MIHEQNLQQIESGFDLFNTIVQSWERHFAAPVLDSPDLAREGHSMARPKRNKGYTPPEAQPYVGIRTAMEILGLSKTAVVKIIEAGHIPSAYQADTPGGVWIMLREDVLKFKSERKSNTE